MRLRRHASRCCAGAAKKKRDVPHNTDNCDNKGFEMTNESLDRVRERLLGDEQVQQMIRARAYEIYRLRGGQPGREAQDWLHAEREVLAFLIARESSGAEEKESRPSTAATVSAAPEKTAAPKKRKSRGVS